MIPPAGPGTLLPSFSSLSPVLHLARAGARALGPSDSADEDSFLGNLKIMFQLRFKYFISSGGPSAVRKGAVLAPV